MSKPTAMLAFLACALILCSFEAIARAQKQTREAEQMLARAVELHEAGRLEEAIREYKAFLLIRPDIPEVRSNLGAALARLGRYEEAIEQYKQALAINDQNIQVRFNLAVAYYKAALFEEATREFTRVVSADISNKNALMLLADCHLFAGEYKKVIELLGPLEATEQQDLTVAYLLGTAYIRDNQLEKGQVLIDRILRKGDSAEAHILMGSARLMMRDYTNAASELERAIALNPNLPMVRSLYGKAMLRNGDRERAREAFQKELEINVNDFDSNLYLGLLLKEDQKNEESLKYFEKAQSVRPHDLNVNYYVASVKMALGDTVEAQRLLEEVVKEAPDFVEAHVSLATVYYRLKRKADGDRERAIILKLNAERQAEAPGASEELGPAYRGDQPNPHPSKKPVEKPQL